MQRFGITGGDWSKNNPVVARAADNIKRSTQSSCADINYVVAGTAVDLVLPGSHVNNVVAAGAEHRVVARAHVDEFRRIAADEPVIAFTAVIMDAAGTAAGQQVIVVAAKNYAGGGAAGNHEHIIAGAAVKLQLRRYARISDDAVVSFAAVGNDFLDAVVSAGNSQRANRGYAVLFRNVIGFILYFLIIDIGITVITGSLRPVAHIEIEGIADHRGNNRRIAPTPDDVAGDGHTHEGDACRKLRACRRNTYQSAESGQSFIYLEEAKIYMHTQRAIYGKFKQRVTADGKGCPNFQFDNGQVYIQIHAGMEVEIPVGVYLESHVKLEERADLEFGFKIELE